MSRFFYLICCCVVAAFLTGLPRVYAAPVRIKHTNDITHALDTVVSITVYISRSTNACESRVVVNPDGKVLFSRCHRTTNAKLPASLMAKFFADVDSALPLSALPVNRYCMKPVSFGTSTRIIYGQQISPDLSCSLDPMGRMLYQDVSMLMSELYRSSTP